MNFSLITIQNPIKRIDDLEILKKLGYKDMIYVGDTTYEECYSSDSSEVGIADFNNCIVINDGYKLTQEIINNLIALAPHEIILSETFPDSEILTIAGSDTSMMYAYSLVKNGKKIRYNYMPSGEDRSGQYGQILNEEKIYFDNSKIINEKRMFRSKKDVEGAYSLHESQLVDTLTFDVLSRHLGITIMSGDDDEFMFETAFKTYKATFQNEKIEAEAKESKVEDSLLKKIMSWISKK